MRAFINQFMYSPPTLKAAHLLVENRKHNIVMKNSWRP